MSTIDLNVKATQTVFSKLVGTSQPAVAQMVAKGVLTRNASVGQWLVEYCDRIRKEAAGRGSDNSKSLTDARIEESRENTLSKRQDRLTKAGVLVSTEDIALVVEEMGNSIQSGWIGAGDRIIEAIQSSHKIELDDELVYGPLRASLRNLATSTQEFIDDIQRDVEGADSSA